MKTQQQLSDAIKSGEHSTIQILRMIAETLPEDQAIVLSGAAQMIHRMSKALTVISPENAGNRGQDQ